MDEYLKNNPMLSIACALICLMVVIGLIVEMPDDAGIIWDIAIVLNILGVIVNGVMGFYNLKKLNEKPEVKL